LHYLEQVAIQMALDKLGQALNESILDFSVACHRKSTVPMAK